MKQSIILSMMAIFLATPAQAGAIPKPILPLEAKEVFITVSPSKDSKSQIVEVRAKSEFSNDCLSPKETMRALRNRNGELYYSFYSEPIMDRICTKQYLPVEKIFFIDRFEIPNSQPLPRISVNGSVGTIVEPFTE